MDLRSTIALLPALLCLSCGATSGNEAADPTASPPASAVARQPSFAAPRREIRAVAASFVKAACEYDASTAARRDFLATIDRLVTSDELAALAHSPRAHLPWRAMRARHERTVVTVNGVSEGPAPGRGEHAFVWITVTNRTTFATVREHDRVTVSLVPTRSGWKIDDARGAGL